MKLSLDLLIGSIPVGNGADIYFLNFSLFRGHLNLNTKFIPPT